MDIQIKDIGDYVLYSDARVFSKKSNRFLTPSPNNWGYYQVKLNGKVLKLHRVIATHFIDNSNQRPCVNHMDGDKSNNNASNLEWCTQSHNLSHAYRTGLNPCNSIYPPWKIKAVRLFLKYKIYSRKEICKGLEMGIDSVGKIARNETYTHIK